jgi:hypothetical protein
MKRILTLLLFASGLTFGQMNSERELLLRMSGEKSREWQAQRAVADSVAQARKIPVRQVLSDGRVIELHGLEDGLPLFAIAENLNAARTISSSRVWPGGGYGFSLNGAAETLGVWDEGAIRLEHQEFGGRVVQGDSPEAYSDHSTHVTGTMIASGVNASAKGMSHGGNVRAFDWNNVVAEMAAEAAAGMHTSNHSWGYITGWNQNQSTGAWTWYGSTSLSPTIDYKFGYYDATSRDWDNLAVAAPTFLMCKSSGNDRGDGPSGSISHSHSGESGTFTDSHQKDGGTTGFDCISYMGVAKNVLTIGAVNDLTGGYTTPAAVVGSSFHGWGPVDDGRIKPDIVANGVNLTSPISTSATAYGVLSGTSMSSPSVTGSVGLLLQREKNLWGSNAWRSSTIKGIILHTADESGAANGPDYKFGWGLMNTLKAVQLMTTDSANGGGFNIREAILSQGGSIVFNVESDGTQPIRASICWIDPAANPVAPVLNSTALMLINDLDIRVLNGPTTYYPWILDPANPNTAATTGDNFRDNVEQIHIGTPPAGIYTVSVTHKGVLSGGSQNVSIILSGVAPLSNGEIHGLAFNDVSGDSDVTPGDGGVAAVTVRLFREGLAWDSTQTDSTGSYGFTGLIAGEYAILADVPEGWTQTHPAENDTQTVTVVLGTNATDIDFGLFRFATISGSKYNDLNDDGIHDVSDPPVSGWKIYLGGDRIDSVLTDAGGEYEFELLPIGSYSVSEASRAGWRQTAPPGSTFAITIDSSRTVAADLDFGNFSEHTIVGTKYNDVNGNSVRDSGEVGIPNWQIVANGPVNDTTQTDADGRYVLDGLGSGSYTVIEENRLGWQQTYPAGAGTHSVTFLGPEEAVTGMDFGNFRLGFVTGSIFDDDNQNGFRDPEDQPLVGWSVRITPADSVDPLMTVLTDVSGNYVFYNLFAGTYGVCVIPPADWVQTLPVGCYSVTVASGDSLSGNAFGMFHLGSISGTVYHDRNNNGVQDGDQPIPIQWRVVLEPSSTPAETTVTDAQGKYSFTDLPFGIYTVRQLPDTGWVDTYRSGVPYTVNVTSGIDTTGLNFGNFLGTEAISYRTARSEDWATAIDTKGKLVSLKRKPDKVDVAFQLGFGLGNPQLTLEFSMDVVGKVSRVNGDSLYAFVGKKPAPMSLSIAPGETVVVTGWGNKGKAVKAKYAWGANKKAAVTSFLLNQPRLPMPNLHNVGEDLFAANAFPAGLLIGVPQGSAGANSVKHPKYKDVKKSFNKSGFLHSGTPRCLATYVNGKPISKQQKSLPPDKHSNRLFAEVLALRLNVTASVYGIFPNGLGELVYDVPDTTTRFDGKSVGAILSVADSVLSCMSVLSVDTASLPAALYDAVRNINVAFLGPMDTVSFVPTLVTLGVKPVNAVPYLRTEYGVIPLSVKDWQLSSAAVPEVFELKQNYPNPFNPATTISFSLVSTSIVSLRIYNVLGQEVASLMDAEVLDEGEESVEFDAAGLPSGVYYYRLTARPVDDDGVGASFEQIRKMMLIR